MRYVRRALNLAFLAPKIVEANRGWQLSDLETGTRWRSGMDSNPRVPHSTPLLSAQRGGPTRPPCRRGSDSISSRADEIIGWRFSDTCFKILCHCE